MAEGTSGDYDAIELSKAVELISNEAKDVRINVEEINSVAKKMMEIVKNNVDKFYKLNNFFERPLTYPQNDIKEQSITADWLFVLNTLNFSLWYPKGTRQWKVDGKKGYNGLCTAINRAIKNDKIEIWNPKYYTRITKTELEHILRSDNGETEIPLINERLQILHEVGEVLLKKYQGSFNECLKSSEYNADKLIKLLFDEFKSYRDEVIYDGKKVRFLVKARSLVCDMWEYFKNKHFKLNTSKMASAIFIEYSILEVLLHYKVISYSERLVKRFANSDEPLEHGSREEIEIRGCSLFAAKEICKELVRLISQQKNHNLNRILKLKKAFNPQIVVDNFILLQVDHIITEIENYESVKDPCHYIRNVHY